MAPLDVGLGAAFLVAGLVPTMVPTAWRGLVADVALVSLGAAFAMPLAGAAVSRAGDDPRRTRGMVVALCLLLCVLVPLTPMFRDPRHATGRTAVAIVGRMARHVDAVARRR